jgi:alpha-ketoglutarate-dependent 2,4-dichlorophenoxyacetate dioxygenase
MTTAMLKITPLHPCLAAEVTGLDLVNGPDDRDFAAVKAAFDDYSVLVYRDQDISDEQQIRFTKRFGPLEGTKVGTPGAGSPIALISNLDAKGDIVPPDHRQIINGRANGVWHADSSFKEIPAWASMLSGRIIARKGGNTEFASMRAAYRDLPERLRQAVAGRVALHHYAYGRDRIDPTLVTDAERTLLPPVRQGLVLDRAALGKSLYVGAHTKSIEGMDEAESAALIEDLKAFATQEQYVYSHVWRPRDMVMWDNFAVVHRAMPYDAASEKRHMVRTTLAGWSTLPN